MQTSLFIARLMGPVLVVAGATMLFNARAFRDIGREFLASPALIFIAGFLALLGGLAIVNTHNVWAADWPVIITVFGWLAVLGGVIRMGFPALTRKIGQGMMARKRFLQVAAAVQLLLGAYLMAMGYF